MPAGAAQLSAARPFSQGPGTARPVPAYRPAGLHRARGRRAATRWPCGPLRPVAAGRKAGIPAGQVW